jgi:hypothetical protein
MAFAIFPIGDVSLNTVQGVSDYWVRLPVGSKPIRNITTQLWGSVALALVGGCTGVFLESLKVADSLLLHACDVAWADTGANITQSIDLADFKTGTGSMRLDFVVATAVGAAVHVVGVIAALSLETYTHIEYWIKSSKVTAAGDLTLNLGTANLAASTEVLPIPALAANVWTHVRTALVNPQVDVATTVAVGIVYAVDTADIYSIWVDDVRAVTLARSVEVLKVDAFQENDMYFALSAGIENDQCKTNRVLYVYYERPNEDSRCSS